MGLIHSYSVYIGEMQGKVLGMAVDIFDEAGNRILETGVMGELICTRPYSLYDSGEMTCTIASSSRHTAPHTQVCGATVTSSS